MPTLRHPDTAGLRPVQTVAVPGASSAPAAARCSPSACQGFGPGHGKPSTPRPCRASSRDEAAQILDRVILNTRAASDIALVQWGRTLRRWREAILTGYWWFRVQRSLSRSAYWSCTVKRVNGGSLREEP